MTLKTNDILNEIEFELMQGIVSREDLGEGIQTVQKYQNQVRSEILDAHNGTIPLRDALSRQLQINDLLLSLIQETIIKVNALQSELYRSAHLIQHPPSETEYNEPITSGSIPADDNPLDHKPTDHLPKHLKGEEFQKIPPAIGTRLVHHDFAQTSPDVKAAMSVQNLEIEPEIRAIEIPFIGGFLTRIRIAIHDLVLFYTRRLASKQTAVNRTYGEQLLKLYQAEQRHLEEIEALRTQIVAIKQ